MWPCKTWELQSTTSDLYFLHFSNVKKKKKMAKKKLHSM